MKFEKYVATGNDFIKEVAEELTGKGREEIAESDKEKALRITRAVLHGIRNRLMPEEFVNFISQLPMCLKAIAVDGWKIDKAPEKIKHVDEFVEEVYKEDGKVAPRDFGNQEEARKAIKAVLRVMKRHISDGEIKDIEAEMPKQLKEFIENA
ncbi:MAG: DUF2267 domain-containing protein [Aquificota bacterium]|nr:MAG: DUF2267 domain-containing protein [Aquificota bacterium]